MHKQAENSQESRPILLVEDNTMDVDFMLQAFAENNITNPVQVCRDGEEALTYIRLYATPDTLQLPVLVLLDLHLPKVCGLDVLRVARLEPVWKCIPFIILTSSCNDSDMVSAYELGVNSYLIKPMDYKAYANLAINLKAYWLVLNASPYFDPARSLT